MALLVYTIWPVTAVVSDFVGISTGTVCQWIVKCPMPSTYVSFWLPLFRLTQHIVLHGVGQGPRDDELCAGGMLGRSPEG